MRRHPAVDRADHPRIAARTVMADLRPDMADHRAGLLTDMAGHRAGLLADHLADLLAALAIVRHGTVGRRYRPRNHSGGGGKCLTTPRTPCHRAKDSCSPATHHPRRRSSIWAKR